MNLGRANSTFNSSMAKLSTGLRINSAADGPADLIISEKFRSQITAITSAVQNTQNAVSMLSTAEGALNEVNSLLNKMKGLALKASQAGTQSPDEIAAYQAEIDGALSSINAISRNTSFGSINLLDGSQSIETTGVDTTNILVDVTQANFAGDTKDLQVNVVSAANRASTEIDLSTQNSAGVLDTEQTLKITGNRGSTTISFAAGSGEASMVEEINSQVTQTGVIAKVSGNKITLESASYGASEFVTVEDVDGSNNLLTTLPSSENTFSITNASAGLNIITTDDKYKDYTVELVVVDSAGSATIDTKVDDGSKLITIRTTGSDYANVNASVASSLNTNVGGTTTFMAGSTTSALAIHAVSSNNAVRTISVAESQPKLTVSAKDGSDIGAFTINVTNATAAGSSRVVFNTATATLTLAIGNTAAAGGAAINTDITGGSALAALVATASAGSAYMQANLDFALSTSMAGLQYSTGLSSQNAYIAIENKTSFVRAEGADGSLEVNGVQTSANNLSYTFDNGNIRGTITIDEDFNNGTGGAPSSTTFTVSGKGAFFQLGQKAQLSHQVGVGIQSVAVDQLATGLYLDPGMDAAKQNGISDADMYVTATLADVANGGNFDLATSAQTAYDIIDNAINEVSILRSRIGSFISNTLESNINSLGVSFENLTAAESRIRDVDFASETAEFTRSQILVQAGTSVAAQANVATQAALQLLG